VYKLLSSKLKTCLSDTSDTRGHIYMQHYCMRVPAKPSFLDIKSLHTYLNYALWWGGKDMFPCRNQSYVKCM